MKDLRQVTATWARRVGGRENWSDHYHGIVKGKADSWQMEMQLLAASSYRAF
jgi:hypothetical protein